MKVDVKLTGDKELARKLKELSRVAQAKNLERAAMAGSLPILNAAKENVHEDLNTTGRGTGNLARSLHSEVTESSDTYAEVATGTDLEYAAIHEFGGTIRPKNAEALAVPLTPEAKKYASPREFPRKLHVQVSEDGKAFLAGARGKPYYILLKSVTIPARPYLRPAIDENETKIVNAVQRILKKAVEAAAAGGAN